MRKLLFSLPFISALVVAACDWNPNRPLERYAPEVDEALALLDGGDPDAAAQMLARYLDSNACNQGQIAISAKLRERERAGLDLGLVLFRLAESYGKRFVDDDAEAEENPARATDVACALLVVRELLDQGSAHDRARAAFVEGNLLFLNGAFEDAVTAYDRALLLEPPAEGDDSSMGADIAFNRALALARKPQNDQDAGGDGGDNDPSDGGDDQNDASSADGGDDQNEDDASTEPPTDDAGDDQDASAQPDPNEDNQPPDAGSAPDAGEPPPPPPSEEPPIADGGAMIPPEALDRLLDELERTPTVQQELLQRESRHRRVRPEDDK